MSPLIALQPYLRVLYLGLALVSLNTACSPQNPSSKGAKLEQGQEALSAELNQSISASGAFMPALAPGQKMAAVYLKLENTGKKQRTLLNLFTPAAAVAEVHRSYYEEGMNKMRPVHHLVLAPQSQLQFAPGGYHIMLMQFDQMPELGSEFMLTLEFDGSEQVVVPVQVRKRH